MKQKFPGGGPSFVDDRQDSRLPRARKLFPRGPKKYVAEKVGNGVRVTVTDWNEVSDVTVGSPAISYLVYWAQTVDVTTDFGVQAGFARAILLAPPIPAPGFKGGQASAFYNDPKYLTGWFYCIGIDAQGRRSSDGDVGVQPPVQITTGTGGYVPPDVEHFAASQSGEQHDLTTISAISYSFRIPQANGSLIDRVQFYFKNYPNLGQLSEGQSVRVTTGPGGTQYGKLDLPIGRRPGTGTISISGTAVTGSGTAFLSQCVAGDYIEVFGYRALITVLTDNTHLTVQAWPASFPAVSNVATWNFIASITIYAVSIGQTGARRDDPTNAPSVTLVLDGAMSAPLAPTLTATTIGNIIRIGITPPAGTNLARILLYRATGSGVIFSKAAYTVVKAFEIDQSNPTQVFQFDDSNFTIYQREQNQIFSYVATAVNSRNQESAASTEVDGTARLDAPGDNSPTVPAGSNPKNLLFNSFITGTVGGTVSTADAAQDSYMGGGTANTDNRAAGNPDFRGYNRWDVETTGGATPPGHDSITEVVLPQPGAGKSTTIKQTIGAWQNATLQARRVDKGRDLMFAIFERSSSPTPPDGSLTLAIWMMNAGVQVGQYNVRTRLSNDTFDYTNTSVTIFGSSGAFTYPNSNIFYAVFSPQSIPATVTDIQVRITHSDSTNGNNLFVTKAMLCYGDQLANWTPEVVLAQFPNPTAPVPRAWPDGDGSRRGWSKIP